MTLRFKTEEELKEQYNSKYIRKICINDLADCGSINGGFLEASKGMIFPNECQIDLQIIFNDIHSEFSFGSLSHSAFETYKEFIVSNFLKERKVISSWFRFSFSVKKKFFVLSDFIECDSIKKGTIFVKNKNMYSAVRCLKDKTTDRIFAVDEEGRLHPSEYISIVPKKIINKFK